MTALLLAGIPAVGEAEFHRYQRMLLDEAGINLAESKRGLLAGRLARRLRLLGLSSWHTYFERVRRDPTERVRMLDLLLTNETSFFRELPQFTFINRTLIPTWTKEAEGGRRRRSLRIWSAGCATGDEPYSVAMLLHDSLSSWSIEILATDLSTTALEQAESGIFPIAKAATIPEPLLRRYMLRGIDDSAGLMKVVPEIRSMVQFSRVNLHDASQWPAGPFDIVLCRNVLIYFEAEARRRAIERLIASLACDGHLFMGHAETLQGFDRVRSVHAMIWRRTS